MKPRQTVKNYHNTNAPPFQNNQTSSTTPSLPALRDIDLVKLGLDLDDMPNLQASSSTNVLSSQEEIVKCLHAIYGKGSAEILQKLPTLNEWPIQSLSPPDYSRLTNSGNSTTNSPSIGCGGSGNTNISGLGGTTNFSNNNNNISSSKQQQDSHFSNSSQLPHQTLSSTNHHFRSTSGMHNSQQSQPPPPPQLQQPQKSVLSLHQHHQNDLSNRRMNQHQHMNKTNASLANLNTMSATNTTSTLTAPTSSTSLDTSNASTLGPSLSSKNSSPAVVGPHMTNMMDSFSSLDNLFYDNPSSSMLINKDTSSSSQQSLMKHQQLQKLLKVAGNQFKSTPMPSTILPNSHRNDPQTQRNTLNSSMSQSSHQLSSPALTISPPQSTAFSSVPKSLLNLAACSSSTPVSTSTSSLQPTSKYSSMVNRLNLMSARQANTNNNIGNSKSFLRNAYCNNNSSNNNTISNNEQTNHKNMNENDLSNAGIQQTSNRYSATSSSQTSGSSNKSHPKQPIQVSLLSDDQFNRGSGSNRSPCNNSFLGNSSKLSPQNQGQHYSHFPNFSKEAYIANLQERAARAGVSIGEINKPVQLASVSSTNSAPVNTINVTSSAASNHRAFVNISPSQVKDDSNTTVDTKEIESALSRVGARNDLSLLYPPLLLASNSQKQINALSAGLQESDESELFTKEVKKIVLEECNIIYECKECNNLFRSLANLVKHKRTYCTERQSEQNNIDLNKRQYLNTTSPQDLISLATNVPICETQLEQEINLDQSIPPINRLDESDSSNNDYSKNSDSRLSNLSNMIRLLQSQERDPSKGLVRLQKNQVNKVTNVSSLSKLLKSQPKNRLPSSRDSALMDALNIPSSSAFENNQLSAFESDKSSTSSKLHEQLVRNSSLAKTLLNEKVRISNPRQSLIELSKAEMSFNRANASVPKRVAPKRKFLEDCIQKVKRDKLFAEDEDELPAKLPMDTTNTVSIRSGNLQPIVDSSSILTDGEGSFLNDTPKLNNDSDSDTDSNMLMIDLETPRKKASSKKAKKRVSNIPPTSSALLKALTRPVDKRPYSTITGTAEENDQQQVSSDSYVVKVNDNELQSDHEKIDLEMEVPSPLCDKQTCDICELDYDDLDLLLSHLMSKHRAQKMVYPCIFCSSSFITLENVCRHILDIHQKPKAQVQRLKEVVRSRSYLCSNSSEFLSCRDHPNSTISLEDWEKEGDAVDESLGETEKFDDDLKETSDVFSQFEGIKTRGKKRVECNQMINNELSVDSSALKMRKIRSRSTDQTTSTSNIQEEVCEKAASIDGHIMDSNDDSAEGGLITSLCKRDDVIQHCNAEQVELNATERCSSEDETGPDDKLDKQEEQSQDLESIIKETEGAISKRTEVVDENEDAPKSQACSDFPVQEKDIIEDVINDERVSLEDPQSEILPPVDEEKETTKADVEEDDDNEGVVASDDSSNDGSVSSSSSSQSSSSSSSGDSSSESSSSSSSSSYPSSSATSAKSNDETALIQCSPHLAEKAPISISEGNEASLETDSFSRSKLDELSHARKDPKTLNQGKQISSAKDFSGPSLSPIDNDSSSENYAESECPEYDSTPSPESNKEKTTSELTKQNSQQKPPSIGSTSETTPAASSTNAGGGIMKLKIQLKTRPDEKSKVYEIV